MPAPDVHELVQHGRTAEALAAAQDRARAAPADAEARTLLFELYCLAGLWDRALTHAALAPTLDPRAASLAQYAPVMVRAEGQRRDVWEGRAQPRVLGAALPWAADLAAAVGLAAKGDATRAAELRRSALAAAPPVAGALDDQPFTSLSDADPRLGPVLELFVNGEYAWAPLALFSRLEIAPPRRIIDRVWINAQATLASGPTVGVAIPVRYPGSERPPLGPAAAACSTEWADDGSGLFLGVGHRLLVADDRDLPLLSVRTIELHAPAAPHAPSPAAAPGEVGGKP
jgi:type VI secretion system protein ImpE